MVKGAADPKKFKLKIELYSELAVQKAQSQKQQTQAKTEGGAINNSCDGKICFRPYDSYLVIWKREFQEYHASAEYIESISRLEMRPLSEIIRKFNSTLASRLRICAARFIPELATIRTKL